MSGIELGTILYEAPDGTSGGSDSGQGNAFKLTENQVDKVRRLIQGSAPTMSEAEQLKELEMYRKELEQQKDGE